MIVQQAIAVQLKGPALFEVGQRREKGLEVGRFMEYVLAVIAAIDHMVDQAIVDGTQRTGHTPQGSRTAVASQ
jgi:hypothetical protein